MIFKSQQQHGFNGNGRRLGRSQRVNHAAGLLRQVGTESLFRASGTICSSQPWLVTLVGSSAPAG
jgi:hypothetical protein